MSAKVLGGSPWMRDAVRQFEIAHPDELARIEAEIPDGEHITLICGRAPRPLGAWYRGVRIEPTYYTVDAACWSVLNAAKRLAA